MKMSAIIWLLGTAWAFGETAYFGWNMLPSSDAELLCDGIAILIFSLACVTYAIESLRP